MEGLVWPHGSKNGPKNEGIRVGSGRISGNFPDFFQNDPEWPQEASGLLFGGLGGRFGGP